MPFHSEHRQPPQAPFAVNFSSSPHRAAWQPALTLNVGCTSEILERAPQMSQLSHMKRLWQLVLTLNHAANLGSLGAPVRFSPEGPTAASHCKSPALKPHCREVRKGSRVSWMCWKRCCEKAQVSSLLTTTASWRMPRL